jgi:hypothetical protein
MTCWQCVPSEEEGEKRTSQVQTFVAIVISVVYFPPTQRSQQQTMHHVAETDTDKNKAMPHQTCFIIFNLAGT